MTDDTAKTDTPPDRLAVNPRSPHYRHGNAMTMKANGTVEVWFLDTASDG